MLGKLEKRNIIFAGRLKGGVPIPLSFPGRRERGEPVIHNHHREYGFPE
jgi:hypothetical protein